MPDRAEPLALLTRGDVVESAHLGHIAVVRDGKLDWSVGDPQRASYYRSSAKPFQAVAVVRAGVPEKLGFTDREMSLICASHSGEPYHVELVASLLERAGLSPDHLQCGTHWIVDMHARNEWIRAGGTAKTRSPLHHNCSGKHTGMLCACVARGLPVENYLDRNHPHQQQIRRVVASTAGINESDIKTGTDGCSAPNAAIPLASMARAYAEFATPLGEFASELTRLRDAIIAQPTYMSGTGRLDAVFIEAGKGDFVMKGGADGVCCFGVRSLNLGVAIKTIDGGDRAHGHIVAAVLKRYGIDVGEALGSLADPVIRNHRGTAVGAFTIPQWAAAPRVPTSTA
jgi:L-asparaginase II